MAHHHPSRVSVDSESQISDHRSAADDQDLIFQMDNDPNSPQLQPLSHPAASLAQTNHRPAQAFPHFPPPSLGKPTSASVGVPSQKPHVVVPNVRGYDNDNSAALVHELTQQDAELSFEDTQRAAAAIQAKEESYANTDAAKFEAAMPPPPSPVQKVTVQNIIVNNEEAVTTLGQLTVDPDVHVPESAAAPPSSSSRRRRTNACIADFELLAVLGRGAYGKVFQVRQKGTNKLFAMKVLRKDQIKKEKDVVHTSAERKVLEVVHNPFIVNLRYAFQTDAKLYFVLDYVPGGELFTRLDEVSELNEQDAKFYAAEVVVALEHLHNLHIIYRDLKPENILIDSNGHIVLTDFGFAKPQVTDEQGARTFCGTVHYMAPEVVQKTDYGKSADWWALGVLIHEMLCGRTPFHAANRKKIQQNIMSAPLNFPRHFSPEAKHLLKGLLTRTVNKRLGTVGGATAVKRHPWFAGVDWEAASRRQLAPPFIPTLEDARDFSNFDTRFTSEAPVDSPVNPPAPELQALHGDVFRNFSYARSPLPSPLLRSNSAPSPAVVGAIGPIVSSSLASPFRLGLARASPSASAGQQSLAGAVRAGDASLFSPSSRAQITVAPAVYGPTPFQLDAPLLEVDESRGGGRPADSLGHSRSLSQFTAAQNETCVAVSSSTALAVCSTLSPERPLSALSASLQQRVSPAPSPDSIGSAAAAEPARIDAMSSSVSSVCSLSSQSDDNVHHASAMPSVITASLASALPSQPSILAPSAPNSETCAASPAPGQAQTNNHSAQSTFADNMSAAVPALGGPLRKPFALRAAAKPFVPFQPRAYA